MAQLTRRTVLSGTVASAVAAGTPASLGQAAEVTPYVGVEPDAWFHDVFRSDGTAYRQREIEILRRLSAK